MVIPSKTALGRSHFDFDAECIAALLAKAFDLVDPGCRLVREMKSHPQNRPDQR